jgi:hypothetical protein
MSKDQQSRETSDIPRQPTRHDGTQAPSSAHRGHRDAGKDGRVERRPNRGARHPIVLDGARFWGELTRAQQEIDTARLSRDAAELGRDHAEVGLATAEHALLMAFREISALQERVAFLEEQVRSTRAYYTDVMAMNAAEMGAERAALLEEVGMLEAALTATQHCDESAE